MWRLDSGVDGQQVWRYHPNAEDEAEALASVRSRIDEFQLDTGKQPNASDVPYRLFQMHKNGHESVLGAPVAESQRSDDPDVYLTALRSAIGYVGTVQSDGGHWPSDYAGPMFLMPGLVIATYITGIPLSEQHKQAMIKYLTIHQNSDGGWGIHIEAPSSMFGTALTYVTMRILGLDVDDSRIIKARAFIHANGGAVGIPSWGKFWLAVLNVYSWEGCNPLSPEPWILPEWFPGFHPSRIWCHARMVYLPMSYLYGIRAKCKETPLVLSLRKELYTSDYDQISWFSKRNYVCPLDVYRPHTLFLKTAHLALGAFEYVAPSFLREKALKEVMYQIHAEDENTNYIDIGPVNKVINMLCVWFENPKSEQFAKHVPRIYDYLWVAEDGMKMQGYNGSQLWDVAWVMQAIIESGLTEEFPEIMSKAYDYVEYAQVREDVDMRERCYRHVSKGGWPFSTRDHGWPISDCTAEALKVVLQMRPFKFLPQHISPDRLYDAVNVILTLQNTDGGWATYENTRGSSLLEMLNPSECFGNIMIDYSYVECTAACMTALKNFRHYFPNHRKTDIKESIARGASFIKSIQRPDGSWYGSWAVCFTYGTWFGVEGLLAAGESPECGEIQRACGFLLTRQNADGGWGESYKASEQKVWHGTESQVVHTSWALMTLLAGKCRKHEVLSKAAHFIKSRQLDDGDFPQDRICGIFNGNCTISYTNYRNSFPIWALGRYRNYLVKRTQSEY